MYKTYIQHACKPEALPHGLHKARWCLPERVPFLVSATDGKPLELVLGFLRAECLSRIGRGKIRVSPDTIEARISDLKDLHDFCDAIGKRVEDLGLTDLGDYLESMQVYPSPATGRPYSDKTIKRRLDTLRMFLGHLQGAGLLKQKFDVGLIRPDRNTAYSTSKIAPEIGEPDGVDESNEVVFIPEEDLEAIFQKVGPYDLKSLTPAEVGQFGNKARDRLICDLTLSTGIRRSEVAWLRIASFQNIKSSEDDFYQHPVKILRKGGKKKTVLIPAWVVRAIQTYIKTFREACIRDRCAAVENFQDHGLVFVRQDGARSKRGDALDRKYLNKIFSTAQKAIGLTRTAVAHVDGRDVLKVFAKYRFHALRHTFAILTYYARRSMGDVEPWKFIQSQLGHEDVSTTIRIYLKATHAHESAASALLERIYRKRISDHA